MNDFRARLINETKELKDKLTKLFEFKNSRNFKSIDKKHQLLLLEQYNVMHRYHEILETRLASS